MYLFHNHPPTIYKSIHFYGWMVRVLTVMIITLLRKCKKKNTIYLMVFFRAFTFLYRSSQQNV